MIIRPALPSDSESIASIYNHYVLHSVSTFEEQTVSSQTIARRIADVDAASLPWLVAEASGRVIGYAYASRWKSRSAYRFSAESSVYLDPARVRVGIGTRLYTALLDDLRGRNLHVVIGGVALPNAASVRLHEKLGFCKVAHFGEVGYKFGRWIDVGYWQLILLPLSEPG
jgi:phosphinothricin acetyltransferase